MGGAQHTYKASDFFNGFESVAAKQINGGEFLSGNIYTLSNVTTPVFNDLVGEMAQ